MTARFVCAEQSNSTERSVHYHPMSTPDDAKHILDLQAEDANVRKNTAEAIGDCGDLSAIPALIDALQDEEKDVRFAAAIALWKIGSPALPALGRALRDQYYEDTSFSWEAIRATGDVSALPMLIEALKDTNYEVLWFAVRMLHKIGDTSAVPALIRVLKAENCDACCAAAEALGDMGDVAAAPALLEALKDKRRDGRYVRLYAARALEKIGDSATMPRKILAVSRWSVQERIDLLERLRHTRYDHKGWGVIPFTLRYQFPDTPTLCQTVINEEDADAHAGAQSVLNWLNGDRDLLHPSMPDTSKQSQELVRPVAGSEKETAPETLLRAGQEPDQSIAPPPTPPTLWKRLFGKR